MLRGHLSPFTEKQKPQKIDVSFETEMLQAQNFGNIRKSIVSARDEMRHKN